MEKGILENLVSQGKSTYKIAEITNKSQTAIIYWLKKFSLKTKIIRSVPKVVNEGNKICSFCKEEKELSKFYLRDNKRTHSWCKSCSNKNTVIWQRKIKEEAINYKGGKCIKCGYNKCQGALDFHHLDPSKKEFNISEKKNSSFETIKKELDKCILLCRNCHSELHFYENDN